MTLLFAASALLALLIVPVSTRAAVRLGIIDHPGLRKVHLHAIPRAGGWGIVFGALIPLCFMAPLDRPTIAFLVAAAILFVFGAWDDARNLNHRAKFVGQILSVSVVVFIGDVFVHRLPFFSDAEFPLLAGQLFTVFALVGAINAVNHSDGLDGLAAGECVISIGSITALSVISLGTDNGLDWLACAVLGSTIAFLKYNSRPASVFMGDTGSQFLGLTLGALTVHLTQAPNSTIAPAAALPLMGMPVLDILVTLVRRIRTGMHWFAGSRNHTHHRLLDCGLSHGQSVAVLYCAHALLVCVGLLFHDAYELVVICVYLGTSAALLCALQFLEKRIQTSQARNAESAHRTTRQNDGQSAYRETSDLIPSVTRHSDDTVGFDAPAPLIPPANEKNLPKTTKRRARRQHTL